MRVFEATQGDGVTVTLTSPELTLQGDMPGTSTAGWQVTNAGCCTVLNEGDFCISMTGSLYGKGAVVVLAVTCVGSYDTSSTSFELAGDDWSKQLPQINTAIENLLAAYLAPYGWR